MKSRYLIYFCLLLILSAIFSSCNPAVTPTKETNTVTETSIDPLEKTESVVSNATTTVVQESTEPVVPPGHLGSEGTHARLECESCHINGVYKGTSSTCVSCHTEPDLHSGQFGTDCTICHSPTSWSSADYNGPHTFPMDHKSANRQCATCHPDSVTSFTCFGCHDFEEIAEEHDDEDISNLNCMECHPDGREHDD